MLIKSFINYNTLDNSLSKIDSRLFCSSLPVLTTNVLQTEDQKIKLVDLREAVNTDHIVEDLVKDLLSENKDLTASATHLFKGLGSGKLTAVQSIKCENEWYRDVDLCHFSCISYNGWIEQ